MAPRCSKGYSGFSKRLQIKLLLFYLDNFYSFGIMRLKYDKSQNRVQLTPNSVKVSWAVGGLFLMFFIIALHMRLSQKSMEVIVFYCFLLLQPRSVFERRVLLINGILRISKQLDRKCKHQWSFNWTTPLIVLSRSSIFYYAVMILHGWSPYRCLFVLPLFITEWCLYLTAQLVSTALTTVCKYLKFINEAIKKIEENLPLPIQRMQHNRMRRRQRRLRLLQSQQQSCRRITEMAYDCLGPQIFMMTYFSINYLVPILSEPLGDHNIIEVLLLTYLMRSFFISLNEISTEYHVSDNTMWWHRIYHLYFDEALCYHTWIDKCLTTWRVEDWSESGVQDAMYYLLHPKLQILGMFSPDSRFLWRVFLVSCSFIYFNLVILEN
ncbi:hypothetical protein KR018_005014 [Drosophila ironensis]|nr:hypothetical protein KR018_005014 [Drosophila ironensis]